ncbi:unnamed protein product, partial [Ixodes hexagonus]
MLTRGLRLGVCGDSSGSVELRGRGSALPSLEDAGGPTGDVSDRGGCLTLKASSDGSVAERPRKEVPTLRMVSKELDRDFLAFSLRLSKVNEGALRSR